MKDLPICQILGVIIGAAIGLWIGNDLKSGSLVLAVAFIGSTVGGGYIGMQIDKRRGHDEYPD